MANASVSVTPSSRQPSAADIVAGLSVAGLLVPEAVAYSSIAGLRPEHAIFAAVAGLITYALFGRSRYAIVAPTSSSAAIIAAAVTSLSSSGGDKLALAYALVLMAGLTFVAAGVARLGGLADFISRPVLHGFAFGLALTIVIKQLPAIAGVRASGPVEDVLWDLFRQAAVWKPASLGIGLVALALLFALKKFPNIPGAFVVLAATMMAAATFGWCDVTTACVGPINAAPLMPGVPSITFEQWSRVAQLAAPLALIIYAESWGSMRTYALRHGQTLDADREMIALGCANLVAGLVRGQAVGAGFSATSANESAGGRSRLAGVVAALAIAAIMAAAAKYFAYLPEAALAAVVISALAHALNPAPLTRLWKLNRDQYIALGAAVAVLAFGVLNGMLIAIALSLAALLRRFSRPAVLELGQLGDSHDFVDFAHHPDAERHANIGVVRPSAPIFFANAERVFREVESIIVGHPDWRILILSVEESDDFDSTSAEAISEFEARLKATGCALYLARVKFNLADVLKRAETAHIVGVDPEFNSVADAFAAAQKALSPIPSPSNP